MYGESPPSFSNFKGREKHRKNVYAGLFIHCGVDAMSTQTIAILISLLKLIFSKMQFFAQETLTEGSTLGDC